VRGNLVADGDTLKVVIFSTTGAVIPPAAQPTTLFRLRYTAGQQLGVEDPISFAPGSLVSDEDAGQLFFDTQDGAILTGIRGDRNLDGQIDVRDVVLLIGAILGRNGQTLPEPGAVAFAIADVNGDQGINVGDAVCIVNIILRIVKPPAKVVSDPVTVALGDPVTLADGRLVIPVVTGGGVAGLQASFTFDPTRLQIGTPTLADGIAALIDSRIQDGQLRLVVVNLGGRSLPDGALVYLPVTSSGADATLTLTDATVSNVFAQVTPITFGATQASVRAAGLPTAFSLGGARPNPFNPSATIAYEAPLQAHITLAVYNVLGQEVVTLVNEVKTPGRYTVTWDGRNAGGLGVASGVYLYRMTSSTGYTDTKRMTLLK
jgi:hypothetical protein